MIKGLVFDLDDTLYSFADLEQEAYNSVYEYVDSSLGIDKEVFVIALKDAKARVKQQLPIAAAGHSRVLYFQNALEKIGYIPISVAVDLEEIYWNYILKYMKIEPGIDRVLKFAQANRWKVGICTDLTAKIQLKKLKRLGIDKEIEFLVSSEEAGMEKPGLSIFELCLKKINLESKEIYYIGDNYERDIVGAKNVGMKAILYAKNGDVKKKTDCQCIDTFDSLLRILEETNKEEI